MAESFSRPDPTSPTGVAGANFGTARKGFDQQQVREFLREVAGELTRLQEHQHALEQELAELRAAHASLEPANLDEDTVTRLLGEEAVRILQTARESAAQIRSKAEEGAARLLREASEESARIRQDADVEIARRRHDAAADVEAELTMAKQQGREMVEEARTYRERVLGELARRREAARTQIDQLVRSRDRLVEAFERARVTAAEVVAELTPLETAEPDVDLSPTTGPVPTIKLASPDDSAVSTTALPGEDRVADDGHDDTAHVLYDRAAEADVVEPAAPVAVDEPAAPAADEGSDGAADDPAVDAPDVTDATDGVTAESAAEPVAADETVDDTAGPSAGDGPTVDEVPAEATSDDADDGGADVATRSTIETVDAAAEPVTPSDGDDRPDATIVPFPGASANPTAAPVAVDDLFARLRAESAESAESADDADDASAAADAPAPTPAIATTVGDEVAIEPTTDDVDVDDDSPFAVREAALVPLIVAGARKFKRALADEQNEVLDALRRRESVASLDELVADESTQAKRYSEAIAAEVEAAAVAGGSAVAPAGAVDASGAITAAGDALGRDLVLPLRERLARCVAESDGDNDAIAKRVRAVYREWKTQRIDEQLDNIFRTAYARAVYESIAPGQAVNWLVDPHGPESPDCEDNSLTGAVGAGEAFPTGHAHPPAHPGCRCLLVPAAAS